MATVLDAFPSAPDNAVCRQKARAGLGYSSVGEHLPNIYRALNLIPTITRTNKTARKGRGWERVFLLGIQYMTVSFYSVFLHTVHLEYIPIIYETKF